MIFDIVGKYILVDKKPVPEPDLLKWGEWIENERFGERRVLFTSFPDGQYLSTVFLGLDHSFDLDPGHTPILFETILFNDNGAEEDLRRYATYNESIKGHSKMALKKENIEDMAERLDKTAAFLQFSWFFLLIYWLATMIIQFDSGHYIQAAQAGTALMFACFGISFTVRKFTTRIYFNGEQMHYFYS